MTHRFARACGLVLASAAGLGATTAIVRGQSIRPIAATGMPAAGAPAGAAFSALSYPSINDAGQVIFDAELAGPGITPGTRHGIWRGGSVPLQVVIRSGDPVPAHLGTGLWSFVGQPALSASSDVVFQGLTGPSHSHTLGLYRMGSAGLERIYDSGQHMPADRPPGTTIALPSLSRPFRVSASGVVLAHLALRNGGYDSTDDGGLWVGGPSSFLRVAVTRTIAPQTNPPAVWDRIDLGAVNDAGQATFFGSLGGPSDHGIWTGTPDDLTLVARRGQAVPGMAAGTVFGTIQNSLTMNNAGHVAFVASFSGSPSPPSGGTALWAGLPGQLRVAARRGLAVVPGSPLITINEIHEDTVTMSGSGAVAFQAVLTGSGVTTGNNDVLMFSSAEGALELVAREGDLAPQLGPDRRWSRLHAPNFNGPGQMVFTCGVRGLTGSLDIGSAIVARDVNGDLFPLLRNGDLVEFAPGDVRVVGNFDFPLSGSTQDGSASVINDAGEVVVLCTFFGGTQGIVVLTIPAPGAAVAWLGLMAAGSSRRRR